METQSNKAQPTEKPRIKTVMLLFLLLYSCLIMAVPTIAKWLSEGNGYSDGKVAIFAADAGSSANGAMRLDKSENITVSNYTFWVSNTENAITSEVKTKYSVIITLPEALPDGITMLVDNKAGTVSSDGKTYTFSDSSWIFEPGVESTKNHTLSFQADFDIVDNDLSMDNIEIMAKIVQFG